MDTLSSSDSESELQGYSERTLAIIKPEAYEDADAIEDTIRCNGFAILANQKDNKTSTIVSPLNEALSRLSQREQPCVMDFRQTRHLRLSPEQAAELYKGHYGSHHFPHLVAHMSSGPIIALVLAAPNCIQKWTTLMGPARVPEAQAYWPDSLRASYGRRTKYGDYFNAVHGSKDHAEAVREIHYFFPNMIVGPVLRHWQIKDYLQKYITPTLLPAVTALAHERPAEPILWLAEHLRRHNPNEPELAPQSPEQRQEERCHTPQPSEQSVPLIKIK